MISSYRIDEGRVNGVAYGVTLGASTDALRQAGKDASTIERFSHLRLPRGRGIPRQPPRVDDASARPLPPWRIAAARNISNSNCFHIGHIGGSQTARSI
jgi:hypothetical protein